MKIGLMGNWFRPARAQGPVTGFSVATNALAERLLREGRAEAFYCLCAPDTPQAERLEALTRQIPDGAAKIRPVRIKNCPNLFFCSR